MIDNKGGMARMLIDTMKQQVENWYTDYHLLHIHYLGYKKKKNISHRLTTVAWEIIPLFGALSQRGLNPNKPAYHPSISAGWSVQLTASTVNRLGQYAMPAVQGLLSPRTRRFLPY